MEVIRPPHGSRRALLWGRGGWLDLPRGGLSPPILCQLPGALQCRVKHPVIRWMAATLDGVVAGTGAVYEAKFMLPWSFSEEAAAEKYMAQLQHNMWVTNARRAALSIITGGGKWVEISIAADPLYQHLCSRRRRSSGCVSFGEPPRLFGVGRAQG
jgi:hypothetical protein